MDAPLDCVIVEPPKPATATVIWLHGLGADGHDLEPIVTELGLSNTQETRFVFPHAPYQPVTINQGMVMRAWYDIRGPDLPGEIDEQGIRQSEAHLRKFIDKEIDAGMNSEQIVLAGFSQGGVIALRTGLSFEQPLAGILALSTYLPMIETTSAQEHDSNRTTEIFMAHGREDPLIPIEAAQDARDFLITLGVAVQWREYNMPHAMCPEEIADIAEWFSGVLA